MMMNAAVPTHSEDDAIEVERSAFNTAFLELGLRWFWDRETYRALSANPCERSRVRGYLEVEQSHLLSAYDADFLTDAVLTAKRRSRDLLAGCPPRALPRFDHADAVWGEVGF